MNQVVNWFLLLIIFVFDPLAIALVVAANMAFGLIEPKSKISVPIALKVDKPDQQEVPNQKRQSRKFKRKYTNAEIKKEDLIVDDMEAPGDPFSNEAKTYSPIWEGEQLSPDAAATIFNNKYHQQETLAVDKSVVDFSTKDDDIYGEDIGIKRGI
jgi:hypothetical protein